MAELYRNRTRRASARRPNWDYGADAAYFITICVHEMRHEFGEIAGSALIPTPLGQIADLHWKGIVKKFPYARLDAHVIMPNHMHGILIIDKATMADGTAGLGDTQYGGAGIGVERRFIASLHQYPGGGNPYDANPIGNPGGQYPGGGNPLDENPSNTPPADTIRGGATGEMNPMLHESVGRIVRWYKGRCSFEMRKFNPAFRWQARYWDRIIRDDAEYTRIRKYILNNTRKWEQDRFYRS